MAAVFAFLVLTACAFACLAICPPFLFHIAINPVFLQLSLLFWLRKTSMLQLCVPSAQSAVALPTLSLRLTSLLSRKSSTSSSWHLTFRMPLRFPFQEQLHRSQTTCFQEPLTTAQIFSPGAPRREPLLARLCASARRTCGQMPT